MTVMAGALLCGGPRGHGPVLEKGDLDETRYGWCCYGAAGSGPEACTCWEPVYDLVQRKPRTGIGPETRTRMCGDCAYRDDSPERLRGEELDELPNFWCHRGLRRPREWRHPDGRLRPGSPADYDPPMVNGIPYRADGRPAARCGGWVALQESAA